MVPADDIPPSRESKTTSITESCLEDTKKEVTETPKIETTQQISPQMDVSTESGTAPGIIEKEAQTAKDAEEDMEYPHGPKLWIILAALCLAIFLVALDQTIISTAIPKITDHFNSIGDIVGFSQISFSRLCCWKGLFGGRHSHSRYMI
jgi:hypothetical protein